MKSECHGKKLGFLSVIPLPIPITLYSLKHWKLGAKVYLEKFCQGIFNWFRRLIVVSKKKFVPVFPGDEDRVKRMSIVADGQIRMAYLSVVASRSVNGVAALHTKLLKERLMSDFAQI